MRTAEKDGALRALLTGVVVVHLAVLFWHWSAHTHRRVPLGALQTTFVTVVFLVLPAVSLELLWTNRKRTAAWLILVSMFASLVFGFASHLVLPSTDNALTVPAHAFAISAGLLVVTETIGIVLAALAVQRWRRLTDVGTRSVGTPLLGNLVGLCAYASTRAALR